MKKKILALAICVAVLLSGVIFAFAVGGQDDPFVSVSYVENVLIPRIINYINIRVSGGEIESGAGYNPHFEVVSVSAGQRLMGEAGTEFILRAGAGTIIASELGGISDTTNGADLPHTMPVPTNHLLIVPRSDGRGLSITADALVMVRGRYSVR